MRICGKCKLKKPDESFRKKSNRCRECENECSSQYMKEHRERATTLARIRRQARSKALKNNLKEFNPNVWVEARLDNVSEIKRLEEMLKDDWVA